MCRFCRAEVDVIDPFATAERPADIADAEIVELSIIAADEASDLEMPLAPSSKLVAVWEVCLDGRLRA